MASSSGPRIGSCALATLVALYIVGAVSNGVLRHFVQTLPLLLPIVLGFRQSEAAKWAAIPCFTLWLLLMMLIWLFLLGLSDIASGHFTPIEIVLTVVVGLCSLTGMATAFRWRTSIHWGKALAVAVLAAILQVAALQVSFLPSIAKDHWR